MRDLVVRDVTYYERHQFAPDASDVRDRWLQLPESSNVEQVADLLAPELQRGDVVVDPFAGAGSTLVAAQRLGSRAIGVERHPIAFSGACAKAMLGPRDVDALAALTEAIAGLSVVADGEALARVAATAPSRAVAAAAVATYVGARLDSVTDVTADAWERRARVLLEDVASDPTVPCGAAVWGDGGEAQAYGWLTCANAGTLVLCTSPPHVATRHRCDPAFVALAAEADDALRRRGLGPITRDCTVEPEARFAPLDAYAQRIRRVLTRVAGLGLALRLALIEFEATPAFPTVGEIVAAICQDCGLAVKEIRVLYEADPASGERRTGGVVVAGEDPARGVRP